MKIIAAISLLTLSACAVPTGGTGSMSDGTPVVMQRVIHPGHREDFTLVSPEGWTCTASLNWNDHLIKPQTTTAPVPLSCSNGQTGRAIVTVPHLRRGYIRPMQSSIVFQLKNGRSGSILY